MSENNGHPLIIHLHQMEQTARLLRMGIETMWTRTDGDCDELNALLHFAMELEQMLMAESETVLEAHRNMRTAETAVH